MSSLVDALVLVFVAAVIIVFGKRAVVDVLA